MNTLKATLSLMLMSLLLTFTACQEDVEYGSLRKTTRPPQEDPGDITDKPGGSAYPTIIEQTFIPEYDLWAHTRSRTWRIEWPEYEAGKDPDMIPSLFATRNGALNSINYLNNTNPANKVNLDFSLYFDNMLKSPFSVNEIWPWYEDYTAEMPYFGKIDVSVDNIHHWVTERPSHFEAHWEYIESAELEIDYQEGDFFIYQLPDKGRYGGIRIVSENPRIIEVYLAEPNI